ncbi:MAG TPA: NUDIX hydrolase [Lentisphaeria bacterium]|nr:MAG: hypothetical protein A2X47_09800 [Lentisphaerae bacterium GWF2_38_69]HBM16627.1 NUDIX hydrolase [Lentisphaeria bacterium]
MNDKYDGIEEVEQTPWQILTKERVLNTPVFDIYREKSICPRNGKAGNFYVIDCPRSWVNIAAVTKNDELVLVKQYRQGSRKFELETPGGCIERGEDPLTAGIRELREETGYVGENPRIIGRVSPNPALQGNYCYAMLIENVEKTAETEFDDGEDIFCMKIPYRKVKEMILSGEIDHGLVLNTLMFYEYIRNKTTK